MNPGMLPPPAHRTARARGSRRRSLPALALAAIGALTAAAPAQSPPSNPAADDHDLISVARREAEREREALRGRVTALLADLSGSTDDSLGFIASRIQELSTLGSAAVPMLGAAMNYEGEAPGRENAALNAARAFARIEGREALTELARLTREGNAHGRRYAVFALGLRGDPTALPVVRALLTDGDRRVVVEALIALGALGGSSARGEIKPFVGAGDDFTAAAAIETLATMGSDEVDADVVSRLRDELSQDPASEELLHASLLYLARRPAAVDVAEIATMLRNGNNSFRVRKQAVTVLHAAARTQSRVRRDVLDALRDALGAGPRAITEAIAIAMNDLGDDSGVATVTAPLDDEIDANPKNVNARYQRGELFLRFKLWKQARRDFNDGYNLEKKQPRDEERVYIGLARAYAGLGQQRDAAKWLERLSGMDLSGLPTDYPEFEEMAAEAKYSDLFGKKG